MIEEKTFLMSRDLWPVFEKLFGIEGLPTHDMRLTLEAGEFVKLELNTYARQYPSVIDGCSRMLQPLIEQREKWERMYEKRRKYEEAAHSYGGET